MNIDLLHIMKLILNLSLFNIFYVFIFLKKHITICEADRYSQYRFKTVLRCYKSIRGLYLGALFKTDFKIKTDYEYHVTVSQLTLVSYRHS